METHYIYIILNMCKYTVVDEMITEKSIINQYRIDVGIFIDKEKWKMTKYLVSRYLVPMLKNHFDEVFVFDDLYHADSIKSIDILNDIMNNLLGKQKETT